MKTATTSPYIWLVQDLRRDPPTELCFSIEHMAIIAAEEMVGNRSAAMIDRGDILLYGPGDGTTEVMVRKFRREDAVKMGLDIAGL